MGNSLKKVIYVIIPFVAYYVVHDVARFIMMYLLQFITSRSTKAYVYVQGHDTLFSGLISCLDMLIGAFVVIIIMRRDIEELSVWDYVNLRGLSFYRKDRLHPAWVSWLLIAMQSVTMALGLNILISLTGIIRFSSYDESDARYSIPLWFGILLYGVISPAVEELLFRTVIYGRMKRRFNIYIAAVASSMFFGLYHGNLIQGVYGFIMGVLMCGACEYLHTVFGAFLVHGLANLVIYIFGAARLLERLDSATWCVIFLCIGAVTVIAEVIFSIHTERKLGRIEGIASVGCFYTDPTLFIEE